MPGRNPSQRHYRETAAKALMRDEILSLFEHHIYEYKKGLRRLILHTVPAWLVDEVKAALDRQSISYLVHDLNNSSFNIFFGDAVCVEIVKQFSDRRLDRLSHEEDFMLGIMLGYSQTQQCQRYLLRKHRRKNNTAYREGIGQL